MMTSAVLKKSLSWLKQGRKIALISVVETWGSSPNPVGSLMCVRDDGEFSGSVSAGCVEGEAVIGALKCIQSMEFSCLELTVTKDMVEHAGLSCGGKLRLLIQPFNDAAPMRDYLHKKTHAVVTNITTGVRQVVDGATENLGPDAIAAIKCRHSRLITYQGDEYFINLCAQPLKLIIIGAVHIAQSILPIVGQLGFDAIIIDPRQSFATIERFPKALRINEWPDRALSNLGLDASMAVVALAHDPRLDDPALMAAMDANCFYIAALGSRKNHERRRARLQTQGYTDQQLDHIYGPAGLDIGAVGPDEIALSIIAQLVARKNQKEL